jgi:hypothetical protein
MRAATLLVAIVLAAGVLWLAGEEHRKNCLSAGRASCSVLPWDGGSTPAAEEPAKLTRRGCILLQYGNALAKSTAEMRRVPPECR